MKIDAPCGKPSGIFTMESSIFLVRFLTLPQKAGNAFAKHFH